MVVAVGWQLCRGVALGPGSAGTHHVRVTEQSPCEVQSLHPEHSAAVGCLWLVSPPVGMRVSTPDTDCVFISS